MGVFECLCFKIGMFLVLWWLKKICEGVKCFYLFFDNVNENKNFGV